jgi:GAF domain-containing protein/HAMP domain-containing protein
MFNRISSRLRITYVSLALLPLLIAGVIILGISFKALNDQAQILQTEIARRVAVEVETYILSLEQQIIVTINTTDIEKKTAVEQSGIFDELRAQQPAIRDLYLLDSQGNEVVHSSFLGINTESSLANRANSPEFMFPIQEKETYFGPVLKDSSIPHMMIAVPLENRRTGNIEFVIVADVLFDAIWDLIENIEIGEGENIFIVDASGTIVAHRDPSVALRGETIPVPIQSRTVGLNGNRVIVETRTMKFGEQKLIVLAEKDFSSALRLAFTSVYIILAILIVSLLVAASLSLLATNHMVRPIQQMADVARKVREGDLQPKARESGLVELNELAKAFNSMTSQLREMVINLEKLVAERTQALRSSADISRYLSTILEKDPLLTEVVHRLHREMKYGLVEIYQANGSTPNLKLVASSDQGVANLFSKQLDQMPSRIIIKAAKTDSPIHIPDTQEVAESFQTHSQSLKFRSLLAVPIARTNQVLGVLAVYKLGQNEIHSGDIDLVQSIANQLAIALQNAQSFEQLVQDKLDEARQREIAQSELATYHNSPLGRANALAEILLVKSEQTLISLYKLAQTADSDQATANLLANLPRAISNRNSAPESKVPLAPEAVGNVIVRLAEGINFLQNSPESPELLSVGFRQILTALTNKICLNWSEKESIEATFELCHRLISANSVEQLTSLNLDDWTAVSETTPSKALMDEIQTLSPVLNNLTAYERVETAEDKITYLVAAIEQWQRFERQARQKLQGIDRILLERIGEKGVNLVNGALSDLQLKAKIAYELLTRHTWQNESVPLTLILRNVGRGAAFNARISLIESPNYSLVGESVVLERIGPKEETRVTLNVRPRLEQGIREFRARFLIIYTDPRGGEQVENFADIVQLLDNSEPFQNIQNPYIVGTPLHAGSSLFFGRDDLVESIKANFSGDHQHNLVLVGQRRMGKTSLLKQLPFHFAEGYVVVYLDGQVMGLDPGSEAFFLNVATEIAFALEDKGIKIQLPEPDAFTQHPAAVFEHKFLAQVMSLLGKRHLLILFDEFEELENTVTRGFLDATIFGFLRHLMQHVPRLSFIFCGTHRLEELSADYWSVFFNITLYQHVGNLSFVDTLRLIQEPVEKYGMRYDDLVLDKIWLLTSGHPYFLQLLCHSLVNQHNRTKRSYVTISEVNNVLDGILASGEAHFIYLWSESSPGERMVLFALSRIMPLTGTASDISIGDYLAERGVTLARIQIRSALHQLALREILIVNDHDDSGGSSIYRWQLGLLGLWVEKYKSFGKVMDEAYT